MIESIIAMHCSPALAGIKPANIVSISKAKYSDVSKELKELNGVLNSSDIYFEVLHECARRTLVMVYRKKQLSCYLNRKDIAGFLEAYGYPINESLDRMLAHLKYRVSKDERFPHEIGAFLGYPLHDILGFLNHKDSGCKLIGYWKVYDHEKETKLLFERYDRCRKAILRRITEGHSLVRLFCT